ncbi:ABC transporter ATP-binding protein [Leucobacter aridicollis]|uniref:Peptide/nickel transport system ATP-binding protein n=1 Tax=Leucobacter aridicollis TaxID=283878 RepID=A0A852R939_9MICO|nr:ATP-binding cassette domain-containing protein [Leucobacter aridicollis]MBL3681597.1 ABC transporter ATP-binding protein [Leucobacter aridicollis]NYD27368.1 peptide/nickel transport system ATP-binding protein [Leucobacter aridicollis]
MSLVEVSELHRVFRLGSRGRASAADVTAVNRVSFSIDRGESVGLVGESGSGKSTIARILVGLERPDSGEVRLGGVDRLAPARGREARLARARAVQMVFQDPNGSLDRRLTVAETLGRAMRLHGIAASSADARTRTLALLDRVGLSERHADAKPHELSGGQRQRVAIARALAVEPELLVLDEAVSALDVSVQAQVLDLLSDIRQETGVGYLFVSHDLAVIQEVCDRVLVLYRGTVVEEGTTAEVLGAPEHAYTKLLISSTPGPGWDPERVVRDRMSFTQAIALDQV